MERHTTWMVRAGEGGYLFSDFEHDSFVAIGWNEIPNLETCESREEIRSHYENTYPDDKPRAASNAVGMIYKFRTMMKLEDRVLTYNPESREYLVGRIKSAYDYDQNYVMPHFREVVWEGKVTRDSLKTSTRNSLGGIQTLFQPSDDAIDDIESVLSGREGGSSESVDEERVELEQIREDTINRAHELLKDKILELGPDEVEFLVAALLRAMGYKTRVSPKGPDRGVDIAASPDGLGFEQPRIKVEVKHRQQAQGSQQIRSFLGGLREGDNGLFVSTGGFSREALYEADRANIPMTLLTLDELARMIRENYESFDTEGRIMIPLTRVYWPSE